MNGLPNCHVDYQYYWYGSVSFYIDYVKVMDEAAQELFGNRSQDIYLKDYVLKNKIHRLQTNDQGHRMKGFYMEEVDYSNLACLKLLNDTLLPAWSNNDPNYKMIGLIDPYSYQLHLKDQTNHYADYIDMVHPPVFMLAWYPFTNTANYRAMLPNNVWVADQNFPSWCPDFVKQEIQPYYNYNLRFPLNTEYNDELQDTIFKETIDTLRDIRDICISRNTEFNFVPQIHEYKEGSTNECSREPMNSEISAMYCMSLCYNVKGILPYAYEAWYYHSGTENTKGGKGVMGPVIATGINNYSYGITDFDKDDIVYWGAHKRDTNFYGEDKWSYVCSLFSKIKASGTDNCKLDQYTGIFSSCRRSNS